MFVSAISQTQEANQFPPNANAHFDQFAQINETVKLNASNSTDKDGNQLYYQWVIIEQPDGSSTKLLGENHVTSYLTLDKAGTYAIELIVSDGKHPLSYDTLVIDTEETKPQVSEIQNQKVLAGEIAELGANDVFDPDGDEVSLFWNLESSPEGSQAKIQYPETEFPIIATDKPGKYAISLLVSDRKHSIKSNLFQIQAVEFFDRSNRALGCVLDRIFFDGFDGLFTNSAPVADVGPDTMGVIGQTIDLDGSLSSDIDLDTLSYSWSLLTAPAGSAALIENDDQMMANLTPDVTGDYVAQLIVNDGCLDSDPDSALVTISVNQAPQITSTPETSIRESQPYSYQVIASDPENHDLNYELTVSPAGSDIDTNGLLTWNSLGEGTYPFSVLVTDSFGATDSQSFDLLVTENSAPRIQSFPISSAEKDFEYSYPVVVTDADYDNISYQLINPVAGMEIDSSGLISWIPDTTGTSQVEIQVDDGFGGTDSQSFTLEVIELPPNPNDIAPPLSKTDFPPFIETINFLYEAVPPVQIGMVPGIIDEYRAAVIKGRALDSDGSPLAGVKVAINNQPEYGYTYTREDGQYDLVVNGGGTLTIIFDKGGFLQLQRDIKTSWENFSFSEDVVLIRLDDKVTTVDLSDTSSDFQVVEGSQITDEDGVRKATLLFPSGINASLHLEDGSIQPIVNMNVRATEFTVGSFGKKRMPGELPPTSGYTYAVELSVDEAINAGASQISFDREIPFYVENFLGFPTGVNVPLAYYDRSLAYWIPEKSGRVIKINRIENGMAVIDVSNDEIDNDASQAELDEIGITSSELIQIGILYSEGQSLWRSTISHFTPWDCNWPYAPPKTVLMPPTKPEYKEHPEITNDDSVYDEPEDQDLTTDCSGCNIIAQHRILEEKIEVTGTNENMLYRSIPVQVGDGYDSYNIPLTDSTISSDLKRVELKIDNQLYEFEPAENLSFDYIWDGTDIYDRQYHSTGFSYVVSHVYDAVYTPVPEEFQRAFDIYVDTGITFQASRELNEISTSVSGKILLYRNFEPSSITRNGEGINFTGRGDVRNQQLEMGGWSIESHHVYNPNQRVLYRGDGFKRKVAAFRAGIENPNVSNHPGGTDINEIGETSAVATDSNGNIYFADPEKGHIVKLDAQGNAVRVAGRNHQTLSPSCNEDPVELESALDVCLTDVEDIEIAPNGDIFFVFERRVRKIDRNGIVSTVAGNGSYGSSPNGTPALEAKIPARRIAFDKHGTLYIAVDWGVRKIDTDGNILTVAGGDHFNSGDDPVFENVLATETAMFNVNGIAISDSGSIFVADTGHECVRQVTPDGWIYTVDGSAPCFYDTSGGERGFHEVLGSPRAVAIDSDNTLLILDTSEEWQAPNFNKITKVHPHGMIEVIVESSPGLSGDDGDVGSSQINLPKDFAVGLADELIIADTYNDRIRKVDPRGVISTLAGGASPLTPPVINQNALSKKIDISDTESAVDPDSLVIVSIDGKYVYEFTDKGVHTKTIDSTTGRVYKQFNYDSLGRLLSIQDENNLITEVERVNGSSVSTIVSPYGKRTELEYLDGLLSKVTDPNQNDWHFEYNNNKQLNKFTDRNDNEYLYDYLPNGLLLSDENPIGGGWQFSTTGDVEGSNKVIMTTGEGREYSFFNDYYRSIGENHFYENINPDGTVRSHLEKTHDSIKDITTLPDGTIIRSGDSKGSRFGSHYYWDNDIEVITPSGLRRHTWNVFANDYDGNPPTVITPVPEYTRTSIVDNQSWSVEYKQSFGTDGGFRNITPELRTNLTLLDDDKKVKSYNLNGFNEYQIEYDGFGRVERIFTGTDPELREIVFTYYNTGPMNGEVHTITNPLGHVSTFEYDENGRVTKKIFPDLREASFSYDSNGNLSSVTPPGKPTHYFGYNGVDQLNKYTAPLISGVSLSETNTYYNSDQQLTKVSRPDGREVNITYNSTTGKMESKTLSVGTYVYGYDPTSGKLESISSPDGVDITYDYDGFLPTSTTWSGAINGKVSRTYDNLFRVTGRMINDVDEITYQYDNDNLLINAGSMLISREVQKGGMINGTTLSNVETINTYTDFAELDVYDAQFNSTSFFTVDYTMDKLGRVESKLETIDSATSLYEYEYDLSGRLEEVKVNGVSDKTWNYDSNGNRTHEDGVVIATYDNQDRLLTYKQAVFSYNDNGEVETRTENSDVTAYSFDEEGLLRSVLLPDSTNVEYLLDGLGRRVGKNVNGNLVKGWLYLDGLKPIAELNEFGAVVSRFVYGAKTNVPSYMIRSGTTYRIISDHLGSPRKVIDASTGVVAQEIIYDVWGNVISDSNPGFQPFGFAGGLYDPDTALTRFGMREYDATVGRWLSKDPLLFNGKDSNLYTYAFNDPVNFRDDDGEIANWVAGGLVVGLAQGLATLNATGDIGSALSGFVAGFISGALPVLKLSKANPGKALGEITAEISDVLGGIALDIGLTLIFDTDVFVPNAEAATLEEHTIEGDHEHGLKIYICSGSGDCPPAEPNACIAN